MPKAGVAINYGDRPASSPYTTRAAIRPDRRLQTAILQAPRTRRVLHVRAGGTTLHAEINHTLGDIQSFTGIRRVTAPMKKTRGVLATRPYKKPARRCFLLQSGCSPAQLTYNRTGMQREKCLEVSPSTS